MSLESFYVKICTGWLILLGIMGLLLTGFTGEARSLLWMQIDPVASWIYLAIGLIGTATLTTDRGTRRFAAAIGPVLILWGVLGLLSGGAPGDWATDDAHTVLMHLVLGIAGVIATYLPRALRDSASA